MTLPRLLIVDDERDNVEALKRLLRKDFEIFSALSGEEALETLARAGSVDVILSDQRMPGMSGSEFLECAQRLDDRATRVLLTGFSDVDAVIDAVNRGQIWRYIAKPWEPEDLRVSLRQAAERAQLRRDLERSHRDLERAATELKARDWSRERLLAILLHEFRTAPQILEALRSLDPGGKDADARVRFIENLSARFAHMERDIDSLMQEEKRIASLPTEPVSLGELLKELDPSVDVSAKGKTKILANRASLKETLLHLLELLRSNSADAPVQLSVVAPDGPDSDFCVTFKLESARPILPKGLEKESLPPALAWPVLLEPFVGAENFARHSVGLRTESARLVRLLAAMGGRTEFRVDAAGTRVELALRFKPLSVA